MLDILVDLAIKLWPIDLWPSGITHENIGSSPYIIIWELNSLFRSWTNQVEASKQYHILWKLVITNGIRIEFTSQCGPIEPILGIVNAYEPCDGWALLGDKQSFCLILELLTPL